MWERRASFDLKTRSEWALASTYRALRSRSSSASPGRRVNLSVPSALQIKVVTTSKPYRLALNFANPYAYWGAHLIAEFDTTARTILTAKHVGLMSGNLAAQSLRGCAGSIRSLFAVPQGYRVLRIDREAVIADSKTANEAAEFMGEIPQAVLLGEHSAALTPRKAQA